MPDEQEIMTEDTAGGGKRTGRLAVSVWRGDASGGSYQRFEVPQQPSQTVLDVVTWIQQQDDPTLTYRFACRVGMCGSCSR